MRLSSGELGSLLVSSGLCATTAGSAHGSALKGCAWTPMTSKLSRAPAAYMARMNSRSGIAWALLVVVGDMPAEITSACGSAALMAW